MKSLILGAVVLIVTTSLPIVPDATACTVIGVGRDASVDGSVIVSHSDAGPDSRITVVHGRTFSAGEMAPVYWGIQDPTLALDDDGEVLGEIPQASETFTYFHSAYSQMNEHQLAIAESTTNQRAELVVERGEGDQIMTIEQAQIFALQRCRTATEAIALIGELMETWGFLPSSGDGSEALVIGDPEDLWVFEVFGVGPGWSKSSGAPGAVWAAQRVPSDHVLMIPNWSIIKEIDATDRDRFMVSSNYMQEAVDRGWYDPRSGLPFIWQEAYAPVPREFATGRFWLFYTTWAPDLAQWPDRSIGTDAHRALNQYFQAVEPLSMYPFSVQPVQKLSVRDVIAFQRSTFEGTIYDMSEQPQWQVTDEDGNLVKSPLATPFPGSDLRRLLKLTYRRPVARHRGHYGMVTQLRSWLPNAVGGVYWVYLDNPVFSPYVPIHAGVQATSRAYQIYDPEAYSDASARWTIDFVDNLANLKFQQAIADVRAVRDPFEDRLFGEQQRVEEEAVRLYERSPEEAEAYLTTYTQGVMDEVPAMFIDLREALIVKLTNNRE